MPLSGHARFGTHARHAIEQWRNHGLSQFDCGISRVGITSPWAQAAASLYQSFLPVPNIAQARMLNTFLGQLLDTYFPLTFFRDLFLALAASKAKPRLVVFTDSSLANRPGNYPQACQLLFLSQI